MMCPLEFEKFCNQFDKKIEDAEKRVDELKKEKQAFKDDYVRNTFARSGYSVGQKIVDKDGRIWFVSGAHECRYHVYLDFNPPKKDGTMSKVRFLARGEPRIDISSTYSVAPEKD